MTLGLHTHTPLQFTGLLTVDTFAQAWHPLIAFWTYILSFIQLRSVGSSGECGTRSENNKTKSKNSHLPFPLKSKAAHHIRLPKNPRLLQFHFHFFLSLLTSFGLIGIQRPNRCPWIKSSHVDRFKDRDR